MDPVTLGMAKADAKKKFLPRRFTPDEAQRTSADVLGEIHHL
ncbi:hypothetical protein [Rhodococcus sp. B10]|nr:hypothetical protein [Rhodococcus sp. B10]